MSVDVVNDDGDVDDNVFDDVYTNVDDDVYDDDVYYGVYNDVDDDVEYDLTGLVGGCVKVIVVKKENFTKCDKLIDSLYSCNLVELKIIEDFSEFEDNAVGEMDLKLDDTITLLNDYVDNTVTELDKDRLKSLLQSLYVEAQHVET